MSIAAAVWLSYEGWRLVKHPAEFSGQILVEGGVDFLQRYHEVHDWFSGVDVYGPQQWYNASYPPATYVLLWPLLGWLSRTAALWVWVITMAVALAGICRVSVKTSRCDSRLESAFVALIPMSMYATGANLGNGQMTIHVMAALMIVFFLLGEKEQSIGRDLLVAALFLFALAKINVAAPFVWILLFRPKGLRLGLFVAGVYCCVTVFAGLFQAPDLMTLMGEWLGRSGQAADLAISTVSFGELHRLLFYLGAPPWTYPIGSAVAVLVLGVWIWFHRDRDIFLLAGVTGIATRLMTYHGWYDDLLFLPVIIALLRIARESSTQHNTDVVSGVLCALLLCFMMAPGGQYLVPYPWKVVFMASQLLIWLSVLIFLVLVTWKHDPKLSSSRE